MATRKVTLSIDQDTYGFAEVMAQRSGQSVSAWISAAVRREAVRQGAGANWGDVEAEALADDADQRKAEADLRAPG
jgi:hypothetical protein